MHGVSRIIADTGVLLCKFALMVDAAQLDWDKKTQGYATHHTGVKSPGVCRRTCAVTRSHLMQAPK